MTTQKLQNLTSGQIVKIDKLSRIHVTTGQIWLTANGSLHDFILSAGDFLDCVNFSDVVIQAFTKAQFEVSLNLRQRSPDAELLNTLSPKNGSLCSHG